jgi:peptide/nickel transport system substrate-binding protein
MLAEMVQAGEIPPVEERLPKDPLVVPVYEEIGQYGGTCRRGRPAGRAVGSRFWREPFISFTATGQGLEPNVFSAWEVSEDGQTFDFHLREGLKWSDGEPVTTEDFMFYYDDILLNEDLTPSFPSRMVAEGEPAVWEAIDDYTLRISFVGPLPLLPLHFAQPWYPSFPKHYLQQFHPNYAGQEKADQQAADNDYEFWYQYFGTKSDMFDNPDLPTWNTWVTTTARNAPEYTVVRNPYYYKVDPEGNQLPYIDRVVDEEIADEELYVTKAIAGEFDLQFMYLQWAENHPILKENEENGDYRVLVWQQTLGNSYMIMFNQSYIDDPVVANYITNKKFRQALSHAIDREDFNNIQYYGKGTIRQATVIDSSPDFKPEYATRYIEYDPDLANQWLDELGLDERDSEGYRIAPETGEPLVLTMFAVEWVGTGAELISEYWREVGIKSVIKIEDNTVHYQRMTANELVVSFWTMDTAWYPAWLTYAYWIVPWVQGASRIGPAFGLWRDTNGQDGIEPTGDMAMALNLFDQAVVETDEDKRVELASQVLDIASENLWAIGTAAFQDHDIVVKNNLRNVPETGLSDWLMRSIKNGHPEQFFFKQS